MRNRIASKTSITICVQPSNSRGYRPYWQKYGPHFIQVRTIAQAVSRRPPTSAARVRSQVMSCGICGEKSGTAAGFLLVLRFPLPILFPPNATHSYTTRGRYSRPNSGRSTTWTVAPYPTKHEEKIKCLSLFSITSVEEIRKQTGKLHYICYCKSPKIGKS
jgi:hypothetical protein